MAACGYKISKLKGLLLTLPSNVTVDGYTASVSSASRMDVMSVEFSGESELNDVYAYGKKLTVVLRNLSIPDLSGQRLILEDVNGSYYLIEEEFDSSVTWRFNLDKSTEQTTWDIEFPANLQVFPCTVTTVIPPSTDDSCDYHTTSEPTLVVSPRATTLVDIGREYVLSDDRVELDGQVVYTVSFDGNKYEHRAQVTMPLSASVITKGDEFQKFMLYRHVTAVKSQQGWYVSGIEHGADVQVDIQANDTNENGSVTMTFTDTCDDPCLFFEELTVHGGEGLYYDYVKYAHDGTQGFQCVGDGTAQYLLQRGFYQDSTASTKYKVLNGFANRFRNLDVVGTFYGYRAFSNPDCVVYNSLSTTFAANIVFNGVGRNKVGSVFSESSDWEVTSKPSFVTVTPDHGDGGDTTSVTITTSGTTPASGSVIISNGTQTQVIVVTLNPGSVTPDPSTHDASAFTVKLRPASRDNVPTLVDSPSDITTTMYSGWKWKASIPSNNTEADRTFTWEFAFGLLTQYVTVTQHGCSVEWRATGGYICDGGNSYVEEQKFISYDGLNWTPTAEYKKGDLIEASAPYCSI